MKTFVMKGNICFSQNVNTLKLINNGYLACEDGICKGAFDLLPNKFQGLPVIDYGDCLILPGLIDLHIHAPQFAFRGLGMDMELLDWLNAYAFPEEAKYSDLLYAEKAYDDLVQEMQRGPNTRFCVFATRHVPSTLLLMDKLEKSGLSAMVGKVNMDRNSYSGLQETDAEQSAQDTVSWIKECAGRYKNITPILTPRFIPSCTDTLMYRLGELQREYRLPVQSHLSENKDEVEWVRSLCPGAECYGDAYRQFGLFGGDVPTIMAHCVWSCDEEIKLMKENHVFIAHCPQSNINLSSGIAPVRRYLNSGLSVGLGSDVAAGCHVSIFRAMSDAIQSSKLHCRLVNAEEKPLTLEEAFYMGTSGGGAFWGKVGSFDLDYEFDAIVIDDGELCKTSEFTLTQRLERIVYLSDNRHVRAKYVQGESIFDNTDGSIRAKTAIADKQ